MAFDVKHTERPGTSLSPLRREIRNEEWWAGALRLAFRALNG